MASFSYGSSRQDAVRSATASVQALLRYNRERLERHVVDRLPSDAPEVSPMPMEDFDVVWGLRTPHQRGITRDGSVVTGQFELKYSVFHNPDRVIGVVLDGLIEYERHLRKTYGISMFLYDTEFTVETGYGDDIMYSADRRLRVVVETNVANPVHQEVIR